MIAYRCPYEPTNMRAIQLIRDGKLGKIQAIETPEERSKYVAERRREYEDDIDLLHLASENVVDAVVQPDELRTELIRRLQQARTKDREFSKRRHGVPPV